MFRPFPVFIGSRYTRARRRSHFISFISLTSIIGLALGVLVMILVLSVMNGFDREMQQKVLGMVPHATLEAYQPLGNWHELSDELSARPEVAAVAPFIQLRGLLSNNGVVQKVLLNGVQPELEDRVSIISRFFLPEQGSLASLQPGEFGIVIGDKAANNLGVKIGDKVTFIAPDVAVTPAGVFPRMKRFTVVGLFHVGAGELDGYLGIVHIADAGRLHRWKPDHVQGLRLKLHDLFQAPQLAWELVRDRSNKDYDYYASDWTRSHGNLYQAIRMEKSMIGMLLLLIIAVAAFNIISTLIMVVNDKRSDIAILRTLGATPRQILRHFHGPGHGDRSDRHRHRLRAGHTRRAQCECRRTLAGRRAGPPVPQFRRVFHRLSAVPGDGTGCAADLWRGTAAEFPGDPVSGLACLAHAACGGFAL